MFFDQSSSLETDEYHIHEPGEKGVYLSDNKNMPKSNISLLLACSVDGIIYWTLNFDNNETIFNSNVLLHIHSLLIADSIAKNKYYCVIMDNGGVNCNSYIISLLHNMIESDPQNR